MTSFEWAFVVTALVGLPLTLHRLRNRAARAEFVGIILRGSQRVDDFVELDQSFVRCGFRERRAGCGMVSGPIGRCYLTSERLVVSFFGQGYVVERSGVSIRWRGRRWLRTLVVENGAQELEVSVEDDRALVERLAELGWPVDRLAKDRR